MKYQRRVNEIERYLTVSLPDSFCKELCIEEGDTVLIGKQGKKITIEKGKDRCKNTEKV